jgi:hypothetical protein
MTKLNLNINGLAIDLGIPLDSTKLKKHKINKPRLLSGLLIKKESGQTIYWSKNCYIYCFSNKFTLFPNLDTSSGTKLMYGTSAYLYFTDNRLDKVTFQFIGNEFAADWIINKFRESATETLGEPSNEGGNSIWSDSVSYLITEKILGSSHAHFHWIRK